MASPLMTITHIPKSGQNYLDITVNGDRYRMMSDGYLVFLERSDSIDIGRYIRCKVVCASHPDHAICERVHPTGHTCYSHD